MAGGFQHDIAGGSGNLVVGQVQSPNYVHGVSGWIIRKDGTAEFHDIEIPAGAGGATVYFASTAPVGANVGDLWYNTAAGLELSQWDGTSWEPHQIGTGAIANNAITQALLAAGAVGTAQIASAAITNALLASAAVGASNIANGAITATQINAAAAILGSQLSSTAAITGSQLAAAAGITGSQLSAAAGITGSQLSGSAGITGSQLSAAAAITGSQLAAAAGITGSQLSGSAGITGSQLSASTITAAQIAAATITATQIATGTITASQIAAATLTASQIANGTITTTQIAAAAGITGSQLSTSAGITSGQVSFTARNIGGITTTIAASAPVGAQAGDLWYDSSNGFKLNQFASGVWTAYQYGTNAIAAGSVTAALIAANTITAAQIASGTITATQIASATITAGQIAAGTITASQIAAATIAGANIAAGTITAANILAGTITASQIAANTITGSLIAANTITSGLIAADAITAGLVAAGAVDGLTINGVTINGNLINAADIIISAGSGNALTAYGSGTPTYKSTILQSNAALTGTSHAYTVSGSTAAADAILVSIQVNGTSSNLVTGVTDSAGNTYTLVQSEGSVSGGASGIVYQYIALNCTALTSGTSTITLSYSSGLTSQLVEISAIRLVDVATATAVDKKAGGGGASPQSFATGTLASSPEIVIGSWGASGGQPNYAMTITDSVFASAASGGNGLVCWAPAPTTASVTNSVSTSGPQLIGCLVSLKSAGTPVLVGAVAGATGTDQYSNHFGMGYTGQTAAFQPGTSPTAVETWHSLTITASTGVSSVSGVARVKMLAESNLVVCQISLALTTTANWTVNIGSLPSSAYYPTSFSSASSYRFAAGISGTYAATANLPRLFVPNTGGLQALGPSGAAGFDIYAVWATN